MTKVRLGLHSPDPAANPPVSLQAVGVLADAGSMSPPAPTDRFGMEAGPSLALESSFLEPTVPSPRPAADSAEGDSAADRMPELSIILASLNERDNLPQLVGKIANLGLSSYELLFVDDGSTDGTREYIVGMAQHDARIRTIFNDSPQTLTIAHLQGILQSRGRFVIVMDSDMQHPPETIPRMLSLLRGGADLVIGSRYLPGGSVGRRPALRGVMSRVACRIARSVLNETRTVSDPISGFFGFRRTVFRPFDARYRGYETLLFMLVMCAGRPIAEVGYEFRARTSGDSKITQNMGFVRMFLTQLLLATRFRRNLRHRSGAPMGRISASAGPSSPGPDADPEPPKPISGLFGGPT